MEYKIQVTTAFGLEAVTKREMQDLGIEQITVEDGHLETNGDEYTIAKLNIWLRTADRVRIVFGRFKAYTFTELFDRTHALPWEDLIPPNGEFPVDGKSYKSKLFSISDSQAIVKKAMVEKLKKTHQLDWFPETGARFPIEVSLRNDIATITVDTSGESLHKRGYRKGQGKAPLKETLAAAMVLLSYWNKDRTLHDPFCGSGTIPIEAAMIARNIAPGLDRAFTLTEFSDVFKKAFADVKKEAFQAVDYDTPLYIYGSDIDHRQVLTARDNAARIGLEEDITFFVKDIRDVDLLDKYGVCITNPPYGARISDEEEAKELANALGHRFKDLPTWSVYALSPIEEFEALYGKKADRRRKLFNGDLKVQYYQYYGPRPPKDFNYASAKVFDKKTD